MVSPRYVVLEGINGCGKGAQAALLTYALRSTGRTVYEDREPGTGPVGRLIRRILEDGTEAERRALPGLFLADRTMAAPDRVAALERGEVIVQDRCFLSSVVHQADYYPRGHLLSMHHCLPVYPDLILVLDVPAEEARRRIVARLGEGEVREDCHERSVGALEEYRERYLRLCGAEVCVFSDKNGLIQHVRVVRVDGMGTPHEVHGRVMDALRRDGME